MPFIAPPSINSDKTATRLAELANPLMLHWVVTGQNVASSLKAKNTDQTVVVVDEAENVRFFHD